MSAEPAAVSTFMASESTGHGTSEIGETVKSYLQRLRFRDAALIERLAAECVERARRRVARHDSAELLRRAIEEAQRRLDQALARALGVNVSREPSLIAGARAALLLGDLGISADELYQNSAVNPELTSRLQRHYPVPQPPEAPGAMPRQKLRFFLFKSV
ncbi:hypothetical protein [Methylococcus geothermalis]|uniref:Uncharacterized protein n=1 Tax=Methylococcus geothermalis TaxID=2681310 RepID=A0A858Q515_9GAMM|nr:hypothetical protein [Methylococcus geothermalis]QJD28908.1 hypothetical protein GNH96_02280 [Methylococcus geothermalis]